MLIAPKQSTTSGLWPPLLMHTRQLHRNKYLYLSPTVPTTVSYPFPPVSPLI